MLPCYLGQKYLLPVQFLLSFSCNVSHADIFHPHLMMCTNMTTILSHQEDLGPSMLDVKYEGLGSTGLVTTPLNMEPNLSECNVSHGGIAHNDDISDDVITMM